MSDIQYARCQWRVSGESDNLHVEAALIQKDEIHVRLSSFGVNMVGDTTNYPRGKKSKDSCVLIEVSQTSPITFEVMEPPLTEQLETHLAVRKKKKKKKSDVHEEWRPSTTSHGPVNCVVTVDNPDLFITKVTQEDGERIHRRKKKKQDKNRPEKEVDLTAPEPEMLESVAMVNQDCSEGIPERTKRKKRQRKKPSAEPKVRGEDCAMAQPTDHSTDISPKTATVTTPKRCTESNCPILVSKRKVKKRRKEQRSGASEFTAATDVGETWESHLNEENVAWESEREAKRKRKEARRGKKKMNLDRTTAIAENSLLPSGIEVGVTDTVKDTSNDMLDEMQQQMKELKEFIPNIESKSPDVIRRLIKCDLHRFKEFKSQGIPLRSGRFTDTENRRLKKNVLDFLALTRIKSLAHLFFPKSFPDQKTMISKLKRYHNFRERIAEGIPRPWHYVYLRGRKMFHEYRNKGEFSNNELQTLKKLHTLHGNNWEFISSLMDRSGAALEKRFFHISSQKGSWSLEETNRLMEAMKEVLQTQTEPEVQSQTGEKFIQKDKLLNGLPWKNISTAVGTRSWTQCRVKWMSILKQKTALKVQTRNRKKDIQAKVDLIRRLYERNVEDVADVDWEELAEVSGYVTPYHVQKLFFRLKVTRVPLWKNMTFGEIVDFLHDKALPVLESKVKNPDDVHLSERPHNHFLLSEIFGVDTEVDTEVDNTL